MPIKVNLPDGRVVNFPDSMSQEQVTAEVNKLVSAPPTPATSGPQMRAYTARMQSEEDPWGYTKEFLGNILPSAGRAGRDTVRGVLALGKQVATAPYQVAQAALSDEKTLGDVDLGKTLVGLPSAVVQTYRDRWADDEARARNIRDDPFGMASDGAAAVTALGAVRAGAKAAVNTVGKGAYRVAAERIAPTVKREFGGAGSLARAGYAEEIPLTTRGAERASQLGRSSADEATRLIAEAAQRRPAVAGLLDEGRGPVPLGPAPVPSGGASATTPAVVVQPRRVGPVGNAEELAGRSWNPVYGGNPASGAPGAVADTVAGPGVVSRPLRAPAGTGPVPGMVGLDDALRYVPGEARAYAMDLLQQPSRSAAMESVQGTMRKVAEGAPLSLPEAQSLKRYMQDVADDFRRAAESGRDVTGKAEGQLADAVARGLREALERETSMLPDIVSGQRVADPRFTGRLADINGRTRNLIGLEEGAERVAQNSNIIPNLMSAGFGALFASQHGAKGLLAALPGMVLTSPSAMSHVGLGLKRVAASPVLTPRVLSPMTAGPRSALLTELLAREQARQAEEGRR
jgi:hypothetical protein